MKRVLLSAAIAAMMAVFGQAQAAGDAAAGKAKADSCKGCHGAEGQGVGKNPALAGNKEEDIVQALKDYKSGKRTNAAMKTFAMKLSDDDMANVAAYYASLPKKK
jgi:cytochrome c553